MSDKPIVYEEESTGQIIYRASALGGGMGALVAARMGMDQISPPRWLQKKFDESSALEDDIIEMFLDEKIVHGPANQAVKEDVLREPEVALRYTDNIYIIGHCDGLVPSTTFNDVGFGIEVKALGPDYMKKFHKHGVWLNDAYPMQLSIYMHAADKPFYFVVYDKENDEVNWQYYSEPPIPIEDIHSIIQQVEDHYEAGTMPERCGCSGGYCPFSYLHEDEFTLVGESDENLDALVEEYDRCREAEKRKKSVAKKINAVLEAKGQKKVETYGYKVTMVEGRGTSLDKKKLAQVLSDNGLDIEDFEREYTYVYPRVTVREHDVDALMEEMKREQGKQGEQGEGEA